MKRNKVLSAFILLLVLFTLTNCATTTSIATTYWRYTDEDLSYEVLFKPDGHIYSYHTDDASPENDFWKQKGKKITMTMNDSYAIYKGKIINDSTIVGKGTSKGFKWKWSAKFITKN
jgi:outer membrane biogenesis lipoprotein LolB